MADAGENANMQRAYLAMVEYLEAYWRRGNSDEVAGMLGDMQLHRDGRSMDPAIWEDWKAAWERSKSRMNDSIR